VKIEVFGEKGPIASAFQRNYSQAHMKFFAL